MPALNTNRNILTVLLGDSLIQGLQIYKGMEFIFWEGHIQLWYTGRQRLKLIWRAKNLEFPFPLVVELNTTTETGST